MLKKLIVLGLALILGCSRENKITPDPTVIKKDKEKNSGPEISRRPG